MVVVEKCGEPAASSPMLVHLPTIPSSSITVTSQGWEGALTVYRRLCSDGRRRGGCRPGP